jgi:hypothetical protein
MTETPPDAPQKRGRGRPRGDAIPVLVRLPRGELAALDLWIANQPKPMPSRPVALRKLAILGRSGGRPARQQRPPLPVRPAGITTPGLAWIWSAGRWAAVWQAQEKYRALGYPSPRARLWVGAEPSLAVWEKLAAQCVKLQREMKEWKPGT